MFSQNARARAHTHTHTTHNYIKSSNRERELFIGTQFSNLYTSCTTARTSGHGLVLSSDLEDQGLLSYFTTGED